MTKVNCPIGRSAPAASSRRRRWLLAALTAVAGCVLLAVTNGAEQNDSGWAVAVPSPLAIDAKSDDPHQQIILRRLLEQTQQPLLQKPSPTAAQPAIDNGRTGLRFTIRPDRVEGWRPAEPAISPLNGDAAEHVGPEVAAPRPGAPIAAKKAGDEAECDCSGQSTSGKSENQPQRPETAPSLTYVKGKLPPPPTPTPSDEETCQGNLNDPPPDSTAEAAIDESAAADDASAEPAPEDSAPTTGVEGETETATTAPPADKSATDSTPKPATPAPADVAPPPLTKQLMSLRTRVRSVLTGYYRKNLNSRDNDPWEVMHGMLAYGVQSRIRQGSPRGEAITSVGWLCYNKPCKGQTLLYVNPAGDVRAKYGVGLQGHLGQLLAMLAQCHVSADYPIHVGNNEFTIHDLIESEKKTCYPKSELTFKLIALQHYIDLNDTWVNDQGLDWDIPRLMREEMAQPIRGAACGGTHRLSGLSLTVKARIRRGEPIDGEYARAHEFVKKYQQYAFRLQNSDGSLSTSWFRGAGDDDDINRRIKTTGHILEWLCYSLTDEELRDQRAIRAVTYLANLMYSNYDNEWEVGPVSHATHALLLYDERVFRPFDKEGTVASYRPNPQVAGNNQQNSTKR